MDKTHPTRDFVSVLKGRSLLINATGLSVSTVSGIWAEFGLVRAFLHLQTLWNDICHEMPMYLRALAAADDLAVSVLLDSTFGNSDMFRFAEDLRAEEAVAMERVACEGETIIGYICYARMAVPKDWWALSIMAISSSYARAGLPQEMALRELVVRGMDHAKVEGAKAVVAVGDQKYYSKVGFSQRAASNLEVPMLKEYTSLYPIAPGTGMSSERLIYPNSYVRLRAQNPS